MLAYRLHAAGKFKPSFHATDRNRHTTYTAYFLGGHHEVATWTDLMDIGAESPCMVWELRL